MFSLYINMYHVDKETFVSGKGQRKTETQRNYEEFEQYLEKFKKYATHIEICGEHRNSFSKTDHDATFMRIKKDYMGNDQLLPAYNLQIAVCDEFIATIDVNQNASDNTCFETLMNKFNIQYGHYPKYPVADAGYGTYDNYIFCEKQGMEKYMKFSTYNKEVKDKKYRDDQFRPINFKRNKKGQLICPNKKVFNYIGENPIKGNKYGRTSEVYECENCNRCKLKSKCTKSKGNRRINLNKELTSYHKEVIQNLTSELGIELRTNRSIQVEGTFGVIKQNRSYRRIIRKGLNKVKLELQLIAIGYNLYKYNKIKYRTK